MMKTTITCFVVASAALLTGACSDPKPIAENTYVTRCEDNKVSSGGYIWTYSDPGGEATVEPKSDLTTELRVDPGGVTGNACHFYGSVPEGPVADKFDSCGDDLYPSAGFGFGFRDHNVPYDLAAEGKSGVRFFIRAGIDMPQPVNVAVAQTSTDKADPAFNDEFETGCLCGAEAAALNTDKTCFANYYFPLPLLTPQWQLCYVYFREPDLRAPGWAPPQGWDPAKAIKLQWDMPQPTALNTDWAFDVYIDDIEWITPEDEANAETTGIPRVSGCVVSDPPVAPPLKVQ
jgi:hypothetical protein